MQNQNDDGVLVLKHGSDVYQVTDGNGDFEGALYATKDGNGDIVAEIECSKQCPLDTSDAGVELLQDVETAGYLFEIGSPMCSTEGNWNSYAVHDGSVNEWPRLLIAWTWLEHGIAGKITIEQPQG